MSKWGDQSLTSYNDNGLTIFNKDTWEHIKRIMFPTPMENHTSWVFYLLSFERALQNCFNDLYYNSQTQDLLSEMTLPLNADYYHPPPT
jgi:hypothetical protein